MGKFVFKENYTTSYGNRTVNFIKGEICYSTDVPFNNDDILTILVCDMYGFPIAFVPTSKLKEVRK